MDSIQPTLDQANPPTLDQFTTNNGIVYFGSHPLDERQAYNLAVTFHCKGPKELIQKLKLLRDRAKYRVSYETINGHRTSVFLDGLLAGNCIHVEDKVKSVECGWHFYPRNVKATIGPAPSLETLKVQVEILLTNTTLLKRHESKTTQRSRELCGN